MIVTISREYGAGGLAVGRAVAQALDYRFVDDQVPPEVAAAVGLAAEDVDARAESEVPFAERMLGGLGLGTAELALGVDSPRHEDLDAQVRTELERVMRERAAGGDVVFVGRLGNHVLAGVPGLLRVFLRGDRAWRAAHLVRELGFSPEHADAEIERIDAGRRRTTRERFRVEFGDPRAYDLVLDVASVGVAAASAAIVATVRALARERR